MILDCFSSLHNNHCPHYHYSLRWDQHVFSVSAKSIFGTSVDTDIQVALLSGVNKLLDILVQKSPENFTFLYLTQWMTMPSSRLDDHWLKDELTKSWTALWDFERTWRSYGWRTGAWSDFGRLVVGLAMSTGVLLLRLTLNTFGPPNLR